MICHYAANYWPGVPITKSPALQVNASKQGEDLSVAPPPFSPRSVCRLSMALKKKYHQEILWE